MNITGEKQKILLNRMDMINKGGTFLRASLKKQNLTFNDIEKIITANVRYDVFNDLYSKLLGIDPEIFFLDNVPYGGHINDIDLIRNLKDYLLKTAEKDKKEYLLMYSPDVELSSDINYHLITLKRCN